MRMHNGGNMTACRIVALAFGIAVGFGAPQHLIELPYRLTEAERRAARRETARDITGARLADAEGGGGSGGVAARRVVATLYVSLAAYSSALGRQRHMLVLRFVVGRPAAACRARYVPAPRRSSWNLDARRLL